MLGPLRIGEAGQPIAAAKVRGMLAVLLFDPNQVVAIDRLIDEIWGEQAPRSAVANLRSYASNLRSLLRQAGMPPELLVTAPGGYLLRVGEAERDLDVALELAARGQGALEPAAAADLLGRCLALWQGDVLSDVALGPLLAARASAFNERRRAIVEDWFEARLHLDEGAAIVAELRAHVSAYPLRERAHGQLMRALYGGGDVAAALEAFQAARRVLADELGLEPGPELSQLHATMLRREGLRVPSLSPRHLPPDVHTFIGRESELESIVRGDAPIMAINGPGGVGKSALAVHAAHLLAERFPDGQLYVDLQGSNPRLAPLPAAEAVRRLLRGLGSGDGDIPADPAEAAAHLRTITASRKVLVVLDNAIDAAQVRPLLPASAECRLLITSRRPLTTLDRAKHLRLGLLDTGSSARLLHSIAGRPDSDPRTTRELVELCGHLPLAIRIAAARLAARSDVTPGDLLERLRDSRNRLNVLNTDDLAVRGSFEASYRVLDEVTTRAFRVMGTVRVPHLRAAALAAILAEPVELACLPSVGQPRGGRPGRGGLWPVLPARPVAPVRRGASRRQ